MANATYDVRTVWEGVKTMENSLLCIWREREKGCVCTCGERRERAETRKHKERDADRPTDRPLMSRCCLGDRKPENRGRVRRLSMVYGDNRQDPGHFRHTKFASLEESNKRGVTRGANLARTHHTHTPYSKSHHLDL